MPRSDLMEFRGKIVNCLGGGQYNILLDKENQEDTKDVFMRATICGKMKQRMIRVIPNDNVVIHASPYDLTHGMITRSFKG
jgi:translation initiation factor IF-1